MIKSSAATVTRKPSKAALKAGAAMASVPVLDCLEVFRSDLIDQVKWIRDGLPASLLQLMALQMKVSKERLFSTLGLARATLERKVRSNTPLSPDESSRVLGLARLLGQVQSMVEESGQAEGFDAGAWLAAWLERPLPALNGQRPAELMDTAEGQSLVANLVARMQSGAYA